jgi:hypothetical protein
MASLKTGSKTVSSAGTAVALVASATPCSSFIIRAMENNAGAVYLGDSTVSSSNGKVEPRASIAFGGDQNTGVVDLLNIYVDADNAGDGVDFWYIA